MTGSGNPLRTNRDKYSKYCLSDPQIDESWRARESHWLDFSCFDNIDILSRLYWTYIPLNPKHTEVTCLTSFQSVPKNRFLITVVQSNLFTGSYLSGGQREKESHHSQESRDRSHRGDTLRRSSYSNRQRHNSMQSMYNVSLLRWNVYQYIFENLSVLCGLRPFTSRQTS